MDELKWRFGTFRESDRRPALFNKFTDLLALMRRSGLFVAVVVDGSFATETIAPNDVDLILVLSRDHDWEYDLSPDDYAVLSRAMIRRRFGFDVFIASDGTGAYRGMVEFFSRVRDDAAVRKGMVRIEL